MEEGLRVPRADAIQLPMKETITLLSRISWRARKEDSNTTLMSQLLSKSRACEDDTGIRSSFWTRVSNAGRSQSAHYPALSIVNVGCVMDWEGGGSNPVTALQLLIYNKAEQLELIAGFGQATLLRWSHSTPPSISGAYIFNAYGVIAAVLNALVLFALFVLRQHKVKKGFIN